MDVAAILKTLEATGLATTIRQSLYIFPLLESIHVFSLALVFGTIAIIDLRLLGLASVHRPFKLMAAEILKWTWSAFAVTGITGALMFTTNASVYYHNFYFRTKMLLLLLSALNAGAFEATTGRTLRASDAVVPAPAAAKAAAVVSLVMWISIIFMGRLIGFSTTRATPVEKPPASVDFDNFLK
jgi:hypothetical protein